MSADPDAVSQMNEVIGFLKGDKAQKIGALEIISPYSGSEDARSVFATTDVCKELLRVLPDPEAEVTVNALKCLINFSHDEPYIKQMCDLNIAIRVNELLNKHVK